MIVKKRFKKMIEVCYDFLMPPFHIVAYVKVAGIVANNVGSSVSIGDLGNGTVQV